MVGQLMFFLHDYKYLLWYILRLHNQNVYRRKYGMLFSNSTQSSINLDTTLTDILNVLDNLIL